MKQENKATLQDIFNVIEGREWDKFKIFKKSNIGVVKDGIFIAYEDDEPLKWGEYRSLADLLANKSWCQCVWGDEKMIKTKDVDTSDREILESRAFGMWELRSTKAFQIIQQEGEQECLNYIFKTMEK